MKKTFLPGMALAALAICASPSLSKQMNTPNPGALSCVQSRLIIENPQVVQVGPNKAMVKMKVTNNFGWPITQVFLQYAVTTKRTGAVVTADPVSLTIPGGLVPGASSEIQTGFFGFDFMPEGLLNGESAVGSSDRWIYKEIPASQAAARVAVLDAQDPQGNQLVFADQIIGLGWTGRKSPQGCS